MVSNSSPTRRFNPVKSLSYSDIDEIEEQLEPDRPSVEPDCETAVLKEPKARRLPHRESFDFDNWNGDF